MTSEVYALIDYDNVRSNTNERSALDTQFNLHAIVQAVADCCRTRGCSDVFVRFYGGWINQRGEYSHRAQWMLTSLRVARGRRAGLRVSPALITAPAQFPGATLVGLLRTDRSPSEQKMVDTLIAVDTLHLLRFGDVLVVSDDEDVVPPALAAAAVRGHRVTLLRRRSRGMGLNDGHLDSAGVELRVLPRSDFDDR